MKTKEEKDGGCHKVVHSSGRGGFLVGKGRVTMEQRGDRGWWSCDGSLLLPPFLGFS